jgi:chromosome segregation ATPase
VKSQEPLSEILAQISTVATEILDSILSRLSGRPSIAERHRLHEKHLETLRESRANGDELLARLRNCTRRLAAKHERNLERYRKARASVDRHRLEILNSDLPPDEVRRRLLVMESTLKSLEGRLETDARRIAEARRRERHATGELSRVNSRWERFVKRERVGLERDDSVFGVLRRVWRVVAPVIFYFLVTDRISGRRNARD